MMFSVDLEQKGNDWEATIDFPDEGAMGLPLINVTYESPWLRFDFNNGEEVIPFAGSTPGERMIGGATLEGLVYPWVLYRKQ